MPIRNWDYSLRRTETRAQRIGRQARVTDTKPADPNDGAPDGEESYADAKDGVSTIGTYEQDLADAGLTDEPTVEEYDDV